MFLFMVTDATSVNLTLTTGTDELIRYTHKLLQFNYNLTITHHHIQAKSFNGVISSIPLIPGISMSKRTKSGRLAVILRWA